MVPGWEQEGGKYLRDTGVFEGCRGRKARKKGDPASGMASKTLGLRSQRFPGAEPQSPRTSGAILESQRLQDPTGALVRSQNLRAAEALRVSGRSQSHGAAVSPKWDPKVTRTRS